MSSTDAAADADASPPKIESRTCSAYNIPIESRTCSAYDIPIESRTCSAYDIPIDQEKTKTTTTTATTDTDDTLASSVIDKKEIASRVIKEGITRDQVHEEIQSFIKAPLQLQNEWRSLMTIVMFLTRLPVPTSIDLHPGFLMKGMSYLPVVGCLIGIKLAITFDFVEQTLLLPPAIAAAISVGTGFALTGCFHEDGLSDSADGIGGGWTRAQIFKIMTDSRVGTYGCAALGLYIFTKVQLFASLGESQWNLPTLENNSSSWMNLSEGAGPAMVVSHTVARVTAPYLTRCFDYVDDEQGPKSSFYAFMIQAKYLVNWPRALFAIGFGFSVTSLLYNPIVALLVLVLVLAFAHAAGCYGNQILGGVMGDYLGATICLSEVLTLSILLSVQRQQSDGWAFQSPLVLEDFSFILHATNIDSILQDKRGAALVKFLLLVLGRKAWTVFVSYKNGNQPSRDLDAQSASAENGTNNGVTNVPESKDLSTTNDDSPKGKASEILSLSNSTFQERYEAVQAYLDVLAKPVGSLGTLETWAARLAALQRTLQPDVTNVACLIFAGDHGAAVAPDQGGEGCSAYPQAVTKSVLVGLHRGVAGASVLAKANNVSLRVVDVGVILGDDDPFQGSSNVISSPQKLPTGTKNYCVEPAMSSEECERCMTIGRETLKQYVEETSATALALGEVGIGNTTSSSSLIAILTGKSTKDVCGGGAFAAREISEAVIPKKIAIVEKAIAKHFGSNGERQTNIQASDALTKLGGAEIAALVGAFLEASQLDVAVLVDGFIATAAALVAVSISPNVCHVLFFTSHSAEPGQRAALEKIHAIARENNFPVDECPVLSMGLRMGEATAALLAVPILRSSAMVLSDMATIQDILA
ncbi:Nicotinate-nucleotide--dimethylbenzimidazole phosphoribosyltransferase [Seminavis robusta]|uniref:Nicotinate-nucleotide--dimethylbenzimidazole phosphoribosyltransferase n=1 Tax=Seminavis robusta TaxID=568900 RepID=A0A9N8HHB2_9STRA|nr:Nicotinate-nucleotide--dimethylbenzimidazole phosphoribosyltransferase [Seminavis robusta]|eukprot:Sro439_g143280.1 Nicotinate-nucleotide--dimethylbenzimidazole phosphoribosyltransferase (870) ;mRNA; f:53141-55883